MKDLAMHLLDVIENSAKAGAPTVRAMFCWRDSWLTVDIVDDGPGLPPEIARDPTDPYRTTRAERRVGLGLALLRQSAEATGGKLTIVSAPDQGVHLTAEIDMSSIDARPLGDLVDALLTAAIAWPAMALTVSTDRGGDCLDMAVVKQELAGVPMSHPAVRRYVKTCLDDALAPLFDWASAVEFKG
jgi:hypothetical protein